MSYPTATRNCKLCDKPFEAKIYGYKPPNQFCSSRCVRIVANGRAPSINGRKKTEVAGIQNKLVEGLAVGDDNGAASDLLYPTARENPIVY